MQPSPEQQNGPAAPSVAEGVFAPGAADSATGLGCPTGPTAAASVTGPAGIVRALRHRNYRLFFLGQGISLIGTWMQMAALSWLVYRLTGSEWRLGQIGFASQICIFLLAPTAGIVADRFNRHRLLLVTQSCAMLQAALLAVLALSGLVQFWHIAVLAGFSGLVMGFDIPIRQSFVADMLESRQDLPNAIALNSFIFNGARLVGPAVAGVLIKKLGEGLCFSLNAASYLAVLAALLAMRFAARPPRPTKTRTILHELKEGFDYTFGSPIMRPVLLMLAMTNLLGMQYAVLLPVFAKKILHGTSQTYGLMLAAVGVGAIVAALYMANRASTRNIQRLVLAGPIIFGLGLIAFSLSRSLPLSLGLLVVMGFGVMIQMAASNTILQTVAADDKRGRVMSFYTIAFVGTAPFGSLIVGGLAGRLTAPVALLISGAACVLGALIFGLRLRVRL